jgi:hypothetical protein
MLFPWRYPQVRVVVVADFARILRLLEVLSESDRRVDGQRELVAGVTVIWYQIYAKYITKLRMQAKQ